MFFTLPVKLFDCARNSFLNWLTNFLILMKSSLKSVFITQDKETWEEQFQIWVTKSVEGFQKIDLFVWRTL